MLELPEALCIAKQLQTAVVGKTVERALPRTKIHKFCWFNGDPADYDAQLAGRSITGAEGFGIFAELIFDDGKRLCVNDGVNLRFLQDGALPKDYQLALCFADGSALVFTVAMYGGIILHGDAYDEPYYQKSKHALSPFSPDFAAYYHDTLNKSKFTLSTKAFLATEQRFPGIGNGVVQDILFDARLNPKRKLSTLQKADTDALLKSVCAVLQSMCALGGRDTEKDLFGNPGGYHTIMSKNNVAAICPACGGAVTKEAYLGGSVYYCPHCQPLK